MNTLAPVPVTGTASAQFYKLCASILSTGSKRHNSSYRRNRHRSNIKPDPDFLPSKTEPHDHIIHNPPPSMPNVYHTPTIFLPKDDKRRLLQIPTKTLLMKTPAFTAAGEERIPPPVKQSSQKKYHLTEVEIKEMRRLREEDPLTWSMTKLAKKFDCSSFFVITATSGLSKEKKELQDKVTEAIKSRWGHQRRIAREDRQIRREQWYRDA